MLCIYNNFRVGGNSDLSQVLEGKMMANENARWDCHPNGRAVILADIGSLFVVFVWELRQ